jgi:hypothetical protein
LTAELLAANGAAQLKRYSSEIAEELRDDNPAIARAAATSLEQLLGARAAAEEIVKAASRVTMEVCCCCCCCCVATVKTHHRSGKYLKQV